MSDSARGDIFRRTAEITKPLYDRLLELGAEKETHRQTSREQLLEFARGAPDIEHLSAVFERSAYPECFTVRHDPSFDVASRTVVIDVHIPPQATSRTSSSIKVRIDVDEARAKLHSHGG